MRLPKTSCNYQERPESYETLAFPVLVHDCVFRVVDKMTGDVFGSLDESQTSGVPWQSLAALWGSWEGHGPARGGGAASEGSLDVLQSTLRAIPILGGSPGTLA